MLFLFTSSFMACLCNSYSINDVVDQSLSNSKSGRIEGEIMIGGLVAIHDFDGENNVNCNTTLISSFGIQRVEAMRYAVHKINEDSTLLPDYKFGIEIRDSCGSETRGLDEALKFVIHRYPDAACHVRKSKENTMFGVVGASTSLITAEVANLLRLFRIPLVSYAATSTGLSDQSKYDYLLRTVPPDNLQSMAMVKFIKEYLKWRSVFVLHSAGNYGEHGYDAFIKATEESQSIEDKLCVVASRKIFAGSSKEKVRELLQELHNKEENVFGIVCYCEVPDIRHLISVIESEPRFRNFRLIGSDNFVLGPKSNQSIIFSLHYNRSDLKDFHENWFSKLKPGANDSINVSNPTNVKPNENPWFKSYWKKTCSNKNQSQCSLCETTNGRILCPRDDKISYTIDAVTAFAHAVHEELYNRHDGNLTKYLFAENLKSDRFLNVLKDVKFRGVSGPVYFPSNSSVVRGSYDISQFDEDERLNVIGLWRDSDIQMFSWDDEQREFFGKSSCQAECQINEKRVLKGVSCCWSCELCRPNEYLSSKYNCSRCPVGFAPNKGFTDCYRLPIKHISVTWKVIVYLLSSLGVLATAYTIKAFVVHNDTPLVKGSGRELSYMLLTGVLMLFCVPYLLLVYPCSFVCGAARFCVGFFLSMCYGSLLVKTNRIARIFSGRQDLHFLTPSWQIVLAIFIMMPQVLINVTGLLEHPPKRVFDDNFIDYRVVKCGMETIDLFGAIAYNIILVILCTFYAFRTRKVPANFNEARYIGFVMYTTLVIWLAFIPVYFGTDSEYRTIFLMLDLIMNAVTLLVGLFGMKLYIIVLRPEKNSRSNSKCRSITFVSEGPIDDSNGCVFGKVHQPELNVAKTRSRSTVHFEKTNTCTSLVPSYDSSSSITKSGVLSSQDNQGDHAHEIELKAVDQRDSILDSSYFSQDEGDTINENPGHQVSDENCHKILRKTFTL